MLKPFNELFEEMKESRKQFEDGNIPHDQALELLRRELRHNDMRCPDDESLCGLVDGRLREKSFRHWLKVWHHEQIERCPYCEKDIEDLEAILLPTKSAQPATLGEVFKRAAQIHNQGALNYKQDGKWHSISSKELVARALAVALGLRSLDVRRGDRVALLSENCPEWTITDAGCQLSGVVDVAISPKRSLAEVRDNLIDTGARVLFLQNRLLYDRIAEVINDDLVSGKLALEHIVFFDEAEGVKADVFPASFKLHTLAQLEASGRKLDSERPMLAEELTEAVRPRDLATIIYTSGTTGKKGKPKPVMLTHENLVSNLLACADHFASTFRMFRGDKVLSVLPLWHAPERLAMYLHLHQGMRVFYAEAGVYDEEPGSMEKICHNISEVRPAVMMGHPRLFVELYARSKQKPGGGNLKAALLAWSADVAERWARCLVWHEPITTLLWLQQKLISKLVFPKLAMGGRARLLISVEAPLPDHLASFYAGAGLPILQGYGLTETSPVIAIGAPGDNPIGTVGKFLSNVEVRLSDKAEIEVRGPNVMSGYYNLSDLTGKAFTEDGWFRTDDLGEEDADGYLRIMPHGKAIHVEFPNSKLISREGIEADIKGLPSVDQALIYKSSDGKTLVAEVWPKFELLSSVEWSKGIEPNTEAELTNDPITRDNIQEQVDLVSGRRAQSNVKLRVEIASRRKPPTTVTLKTIEEAREEYAA